MPVRDEAEETWRTAATCFDPGRFAVRDETEETWRTAMAFFDPECCAVANTTGSDWLELEGWPKGGSPETRTAAGPGGTARD